MTEQGCRVCATVPPPRVVELDEVMGDPRKWKMLVAYGSMVPTAMTPSARKFGATNVGVHWLREQGYVELSRLDVVRHYVRHTPIVAASLEEYAAYALAGDLRSPRGIETRKVGMLGTAELYNRGIDLANMSLDLLTARLEDRLRQDPASVPSAELMAYAEFGKSLAVSAAALKRGGINVFGGPNDRNAGFRGAGEGGDAPSPRMGHHRVRMIEGTARPVTDEGPKDRAEYNARAAEEGREGL